MNKAELDQENLDITYKVIGIINQIGSHNITELEQTSIAANNNRRGYANIDQLGDYNKAYVKQGSWGGEIDIIQYGVNNWVGLNQSANYDNIADIKQFGDNNKVASVSKSSELNFLEGKIALSHRSQIFITQNGEVGGIGNRVGFRQRGFNYADILQTGDNNEVLLYQDVGTGNRGDHNALVTQNGYHNQLNILQLSQ